MDALDIEQAVAGLYAVPPERFTQERDTLVRALRGVDKGAAAAVKGLRRPAVTAWALNQMARDRPSDLAALVDADAALARLQRQGAAREELARAGRVRRDLIHGLVGGAADVLAAAGHSDSPVQRDRMAQTLAAIATDPDGRAALTEGRLSQDLTPGSLWESPLRVAEIASPARPDGTGAQGPGPDPEEQRRAGRVRRLEGLRDEVRRLEDAASALEAQASAAEAQARRTRAAAAQARVDALQAAQRLGEAERVE